MAGSHEIILVAGVLCLLALFAGQVASRVGMPLILVFIGVGMLAGEDGPGGIPFSDANTAYLVGSLALTAILFQGGLHTDRAMLRTALAPSIVLATLGVAISAGVVGGAVVLLLGLHWSQGLLVGAVMAPTDAAAVAVLLRQSRAPVPERVAAALEVESGLNDPMSVFLTVALVEFLAHPATASLRHAGLLLLEEMVGGAAFGIGGGYVLLFLFRRMRADPALFAVLAFGGSLAVFGAAQVVGASGFLATYLAGIIVANHENPARRAVFRFFETLGWLAQITLFLMLGLLVTPHNLPPVVLPALVLSAVLILFARPAAVLACLLPFRWTLRESGFIAWAGLRGAVPIYLSIIPLFAGLPRGGIMFNVVFVAVIVSVALQGWTLAPAARLLRLDRIAAAREAAPAARPAE